mgnify:CR=1 FL=1
MEYNRAHSATVDHPQSHLYSLLPATSGLLVLTMGLQTAAANGIGVSSVPLPESTNSPSRQTVNASAETETGTVAPVAPTPLQPRFSQLKRRAQQLLTTQATPVTNLSLTRLENHRRELHRRSNEVELQLLSLQQLLSIQSYGTSFADQLLNENEDYQAKLLQLQTLEAEMHTAIEQSDMAALSQLQNRLQRIAQELQQIAQNQLIEHIEQAQTTSTLGLWQEPMYRESLRWLMEHTHQRHLLNARQRTLAHTLVAIAPD